LSLFLDLIGVPLVVSLCTTTMLLTAFAFFLVFRVKDERLLLAYLPLTSFPLLIGLIAAFIGMMTSISMQLNESNQIAVESGLLLQMNLLPMLAGVVAAIPPMISVVIGRWGLVWKASGVRLLPVKKVEATETVDPEVIRRRGAEEYLEKLVRPR
jgi:hypothetical protein